MTNHPDIQDIKVAVDATIFTVRDGRLAALLIQMDKRPYSGRWAFPGGLIADDETAEQAVRRILADQTGLTQAYLEQLAVFDRLDRDPFGRVVSLAHFALIPSQGVILRTTAKYRDVRWWPVSDLPQLAYDHQEIGRTALGALRGRLENSDIAWSVLPERFTLSQMQSVYEAILGRSLDKRNFRKRIDEAGLLKALGLQRSGAHRPARLYRFADRKIGSKILTLK